MLRMSPWAYIWTGLLCAAVSIAFFVTAMPSGFEETMAAMNGEEAEPNGLMLTLGALAGLAALVLTPIGVVAQGVRLGNLHSELVTRD